MKKRKPGDDLSSIYDDGFYRSQVDGSYASAKKVLQHLWPYLSPKSVVDVGCGRGTWLKVCHELGSSVLAGIDGDWNDQSRIIDQAVVFQSVDLNKPFALDRRYDLALSLEVAEHLEPSSSAAFVRCLTNASDAVLFAAAYSRQGGTNHINERPHTFWAELFQQCGYAPFDVVRPAFWGDDDVCYWYRQNTYLYLRKGALAYEAVAARGVPEMPDTGFMNCVHPRLFEHVLAQRPGFTEHLKDIVPSLFRAYRRRTKGHEDLQ